MSKKKLSGIAIALLILLGIRAVVQVLGVIVTLGLGELISGLLFAVMAAAYIVAFLWILRGDKRGALLAMIIAIVDAIAALFLNNADFAFGALIYDIILLGLGYKLWKDAGGKDLKADVKKMVAKK